MDDELVRRVATRLAGLAEQLREVERGLVAGQAVAWESLSAQRFRQRLAQETAGVQAAARSVDDAVAAVLQHARAVAS